MNLIPWLQVLTSQIPIYLKSMSIQNINIIKRIGTLGSSVAPSNCHLFCNYIVISRWGSQISIYLKWESIENINRFESIRTIPFRPGHRILNYPSIYNIHIFETSIYFCERPVNICSEYEWQSLIMLIVYQCY